MKSTQLLLLFWAATNLFGQDYSTLSAEELRGALRPERTSFDVTFYDLNIELDLQDESIAGYVDITFRVTEPTNTLQFDLFENMTIDEVKLGDEKLRLHRKHNSFFVSRERPFTVHGVYTIRVNYHGVPVRAQNAPWDGGFVWAVDNKDRNWVGVACQGTGASLWWPNKDYLGDEPDSMAINITVPSRYYVAANGNLRQTVEVDGQRKTRYEWFVSYPINNYGVSINVGNYVTFSDTFVYADGDKLALDYYVLDYNEQRARTHFQQVKPVLQAFEYYLGKYPFADDGFALIETPYVGMEHQSGIAYGNRFMRGYLGGMVPRGQDWDYIIVHEAGHEYFGNSISVADFGEMWIHESFTTYLESLYVEYHYGKKKGAEYLATQLPYVQNKTPILGPLNINYEGWGDSDYYYKGAWMLHTLRQAINDDPLWFGLLRSFYQRYQRSIVTTQTVIDFVNEYTQTDYSAFFDQYLRYAKLPVLQFRQKGENVEYRWVADSKEFNLPIDVVFGSEPIRIQGTTYEWLELGPGQVEQVQVRDKNRLFGVEMVR